jgi:hypothetical protein
MVYNIYTIIMVVKLKHELGIGNLKLVKRRRGGGGGHPQTFGFSFSCNILLPCYVMLRFKKNKYFHLHESFDSCKRVSSPNR